MAKFKRLVLTELGNTTEGYEWSLENKSSTLGWEFSFNTEKHRYEAYFQKEPTSFEEWIYVGFDIDNDTPYPSTDEGNQFKIVATILDMARYVWDNRDFLESEVEGFAFDPIEKRRRKLYTRFIREQFPNAEVTQSGFEIRVKPNED